MKLKSISVVMLGALAALGMSAMPATAEQLFVANINGPTVGVYDATTGATLNASLVSGLSYPAAVAVSGGHLFVADFVGQIGVYDASTGATVNASLVSGLSGPLGIALVPEPSTLALLGMGAVGLLAYACHRRKQIV